MLAQKLLSAGDEKIYVDDVFSTYTYTGNGSTQTITNGIDLAGKGGMVWIKRRDAVSNHILTATIIGAGKRLSTNTTTELTTDGGDIPGLNANGFSVGNNPSVNNSGSPIASWTFRNAYNFSQVLEVTKSAGSNLVIDLTPYMAIVGMVKVKRTDATGSWYTWHRSLSAGKLLIGETTAAEATLGHITVSGTTLTLVNGVIADGTYHVEAYAHDTSTDGIIQCGSYVGTGVADLAVTLGNEPQYVMIKCSSASQADGWIIADTMRGMDNSTNAWLKAQSSGAETAESARIIPTAAGFKLSSNAAVNTNAATYIYLAIRRPNKPPTSGTQVYNAIATSAASGTFSGIGFPPDVIHYTSRSSAVEHSFYDRLRGESKMILSNSTSAEVTDTRLAALTMDGVVEGGYYSGYSRIAHFFRRAVGCFDQVCYTGTGVAKTEAHNLGVVPELMIVKNRGTAGAWPVYSSAIGAGNYLELQSAAAMAGGGSDTARWNGTAPTASVFSIGSADATNKLSSPLVAYLFATKAGISKVFSVTKSAGSDATVDCGFTTGSRFVLLKRTDAVGDWYVWDSVRGIVAGNDPYLLLNSTAAENTTTDYIDPISSGFTIVNGGLADGNYVGMSFA